MEESFKKKIKDLKKKDTKTDTESFHQQTHKSSLCHWRVTTKQKLGWKVHNFFWIGSLSHCCLTAHQRDQPHIVTTTKKPIRKEKMQLIESGHHRDKYHGSDDIVIRCPRGETLLDFFFLLFVCHFVPLVLFLSLVRWIVWLHSHSSLIAPVSTVTWSFRWTRVWMFGHRQSSNGSKLCKKASSGPFKEKQTALVKAPLKQVNVGSKLDVRGQIGSSRKQHPEFWTFTVTW